MGGERGRRALGVVGEVGGAASRRLGSPNKSGGPPEAAKHALSLGDSEPFWPAQLAAAAALLLYLTLPHPQIADHQLAPGWRPRFVDYRYTSYTNATAFSPTDTLPLTPMAKLLMAAQSLIAVTTILLVVARAVNVLG